MGKANFYDPYDSHSLRSPVRTLVSESYKCGGYIQPMRFRGYALIRSKTEGCFCNTCQEHRAKRRGRWRGGVALAVNPAAHNKGSGSLRKPSDQEVNKYLVIQQAIYDCFNSPMRGRLIPMSSQNEGIAFLFQPPFIYNIHSFVKKCKNLSVIKPLLTRC